MECVVVVPCLRQVLVWVGVPIFCRNHQLLSVRKMVLVLVCTAEFVAQVGNTFDTLMMHDEQNQDTVPLLLL